MMEEYYITQAKYNAQAQKAKVLFDANPEEAIAEHITDETGTPLDTKMYFKDGKCNPNYHKPLANRIMKDRLENMYSDSKKQWNVIVGCKFDCVYCKRSFQAQMKRQMHRCMQCYNYEVHFHEERLHESLPNTHGDEFIWACSSCDIRFAESEWLEKVFARMCQLPQKQFFIQSKDALVFQKHQIPANCWVGITLETNRDEGYEQVSKAPKPSVRFANAKKVKIDVITIEPIQDFDLEILVEWIRQLHPMRIYIGYDTKNSRLNEPPLAKVQQLITELSQFTVVKPKLLREKWNLSIENMEKRSLHLNEL